METRTTKHISHFTILLTAILVSCITAITVSVMTTSSKESQSVSSHNQKQDVLNRGTLKCAYVVYAPGVIKDANMKEPSGIAIDVTYKIGELLGLKIEWVEEASWGTMIEGLQTRRYDMVAGMIWPTAARGKRVEFTDPMWFDVAGLYTRVDEARFENLSYVDDARVRISVIDGEISTTIARAKYPKAQLVTLPQTADVSQMLLNVVTGKADLTIVTPYQAGRFMEANPGTLKNLATSEPLRYSANTMLVPENQPAFKSMINTALEELMNTGAIEEILKKYEPHPNSFYRVASPFAIFK